VIKKELKSLREIIQSLPSEKLKELEKQIQIINEVVDEVIGILGGSLSKIMIRFESDDVAVNSIELYGFYSGQYYGEIHGKTEISTHELEKLLASPEIIIGAIKVLASAVSELVDTIKSLVEEELGKRESDP